MLTNKSKENNLILDSKKDFKSLKRSQSFQIFKSKNKIKKLKVEESKLKNNSFLDSSICKLNQKWYFLIKKY